MIDGEDSWSFGNGFAKNIVIFGVNNSLSSHTDKKKNNFLVLSEEPTHSINGSTVQHKKKNGINFRKANTKLCLILHCNYDESYLYVYNQKSENLRRMII